MALPIYTTLEKLDLRFVEAGGDLYANPFTVFTKITFPLSLPGVISGTLLTFIPATGDYINASRDFLGSTDTAMMGNVIEANFLVLQNFPAAAAMSLILMASILVLVAAYTRRSGRMTYCEGVRKIPALDLRGLSDGVFAHPHRVHHCFLL